MQVSMSSNTFLLLQPIHIYTHVYKYEFQLNRTITEETPRKLKKAFWR